MYVRKNALKKNFREQKEWYNLQKEDSQTVYFTSSVCVVVVLNIRHEKAVCAFRFLFLFNSGAKVRQFFGKQKMRENFSAHFNFHYHTTVPNASIAGYTPDTFYAPRPLF